MDEDLRDRLERTAESAALFNALKHESDAQVGAILGPLMAENPEFRAYGDEIAGVVAPIVDRVNEMDRADRRDRLADIAPDRLRELETVDEGEEQPLPELPNVEGVEQVRMRLAPNPNGPWHLGSARMPAVIGTYKEMYDGWMLCRFDDTDPETKRPDIDAYDAILEAIDYLGFEPDLVVRASDRMETYYDHAHRLIDIGGAYTCACSQREFADLKAAGEPCDHRDKPAEQVRAEFQSMIDGEYRSGEMVLRVRTDLDHPNPALRDWVAFRMVDTPHPREEAREYRCWPMLDFQSGIDDQAFDITHVIRGIDLQDSAKRQGFVYDYFDWDYPEVVHWGHVQVDAYDIELSTSTIKKRIEQGALDGWSDPRAPTIASLRRRGIQGAALVEAMIQLGTSTSNVSLSMSSVYAANRSLIDESTDRAFFVREGVEQRVIDGPSTGTPPVHPERDRGERTIPVGGTVLLEPADIPSPGDSIWLKGLGCVTNTDDALEYAHADIGVVQDGDIDVVHWVPAADNEPLRMRTPDGDVTGHVEPGVRSYQPGALLQFERVGFVRLDRLAWAEADESVAYFAHR